jgi:hypothetical protein
MTPRVAAVGLDVDEAEFHRWRGECPRARILAGVRGFDLGARLGRLADAGKPIMTRKPIRVTGADISYRTDE